MSARLPSGSGAWLERPALIAGEPGLSWKFKSAGSTNCGSASRFPLPAIATVSESEKITVALDSASAVTVPRRHFEKIVFSTLAAPPPEPKFFS